MTNQGFNRQKNSGLNLEHAFSTDPERLKAYYYFLQIAHIVLEIFEVGSLLRDAAAGFGQTPIQLFGSPMNLACRLLEAIRYIALSDEAFDPILRWKHSDSVQYVIGKAKPAGYPGVSCRKKNTEPSLADSRVSTHTVWAVEQAEACAAI